MKDYKISYIGDSKVNNIHHIGVNYNGNYYSIIFGKYVNGGFCSIPNWNVGCELASFDDVYWNKGALHKVIKSKKTAEAIAMAIAEFGEINGEI